MLTISDRSPGCGVRPADPDRLDRQFRYDPLARLVSASGRETDVAPAQPWLDIPRSTDLTKTRSSFPWNMLISAPKAFGPNPDI